MVRPAEINGLEALRGALEAAAVRVGIVDRSGRFLLDPDPSPQGADRVGGNKARSLLDVYGEIPGVTAALGTAFAGEGAQLTHRADGALLRVVFAPHRNADGEVDWVYLVSTLSREDRQVEQALVELQKRERHIFNSTMMGLVYWTTAGAITDANDTFLAMIGYTREDLMAGRLDWIALTPPEYLSLDHEALAEIRRTGTCTPFEKEYIHRDGHRVSILIGGAIWEPDGDVGVAFVVDISERREQERARRQTEETLRRVVEAAPIVLWAVDTRGIFTLSVGRGLTALGLRPGQVVGMSALELYANRPAVVTAIEDCLRGVEYAGTLEVADRLFETLLSPLRGAASEITGAIGVSIDVTERRQAELERERLRAQFLQAQKLESLGLLAGGIAHDFNNILTAILGSASTALLRLSPENTVYRDIELVINAAERAAVLTRQMLAYAGKAQVEIRPLDLSAHVGEIGALLEATLPKKVRLTLELTADLPAIEADVAQIHQVVMNLIINAAEAIGDRQGMVLVATGLSNLDAAEVAALSTAKDLAPGRYVFLEVRDTGEGMSPETQARMFDPFFTTKFTGRGLGLAAALGIVRAHRGAIAVSSSPGRGSVFKVFFPPVEGPAHALPSRRAPPFRGAGLALVIDDDASVRATVRGMLELLGFSVVEADDGQSGTDLFEKLADRITLVLVDMTMPRMDGKEAVRAIRSVSADVPIMLMSGYSEIGAEQNLATAGIHGFLEKPFTATSLTRKLEQILPRTSQELG